MIKKTQNKLVQDIFTEKNTQEFLVKLDKVLKTTNLKKIEKLIYEYKIQDDPECIIFLNTLHSIFNSCIIENKKIILVGQTKTRITKCYACFLGKNVIAYKFFYRHTDTNDHRSRVTYFKEFAIFTELKNNSLLDFGVCNGFLDKSDIK